MKLLILTMLMPEGIAPAADFQREIVTRGQGYFPVAIPLKNGDVLADDAPNGDCGYPSSVEVGNGKVVTLYYQVDDPMNVPASASARAILWSVPGKMTRNPQ